MPITVDAMTHGGVIRSRAMNCERAWAVTRVALGMAQMASATVAVVFLVRTGVSTLSLVAAVITCLLTTVSVLLFGTRHPRQHQPRSQ